MLIAQPPAGERLASALMSQELSKFPHVTTLEDNTTAPLRIVSFVIPVRNDAARLARCLITIRANRYPCERLELIVVDNGSIDDTPDVARKAGATVLVHPTALVSELRNYGASVASGDILAFVDADHEIDSNWVASAVETLSRATDIGAVGALCEAPVDGTWVQRTYDLLRRRPPGIREVEWLGAGNMAVVTRAFKAVGGFDTSLQTCEDVDLCRRIREAGFRLLQDSRLRNVHLGDPATLGQLFRGELWRGRDNLRASLRGSVTLREIPSIVVPVAGLGFMALAVVGVAMASTTGLAIAAVGGGGFACGAAARTVRMMSQSSRTTAVAWGQALTVAVAYDLARALALVRRVGHDVRSRR